MFRVVTATVKLQLAGSVRGEVESDLCRLPVVRQGRALPRTQASAVLAASKPGTSHLPGPALEKGEARRGQGGPKCATHGDPGVEEAASAATCVEQRGWNSEGPRAWPQCKERETPIRFSYR
ncbi:hypothetical protein CapIbe_011350 [Capra ibex]